MFSISLGTNNRPKRNGNIYAYAKFWRDDKKYYGIFWKRPIGSLRRPNIKRNNSSVIWFSSTMLRLCPSNSSEKHGTISYNLAETRGEGAAVHRPNTTKQVKSRTNKNSKTTILNSSTFLSLDAFAFWRKLSNCVLVILFSHVPTHSLQMIRTNRIVKVVALIFILQWYFDFRLNESSQTTPPQGGMWFLQK